MNEWAPVLTKSPSSRVCERESVGGSRAVSWKPESRARFNHWNQIELLSLLDIVHVIVTPPKLFATGRSTVTFHSQGGPGIECVLVRVNHLLSTSHCTLSLATLSHARTHQRRVRAWVLVAHAA